MIYSASFELRGQSLKSGSGRHSVTYRRSPQLPQATTWFQFFDVVVWRLPLSIQLGLRQVFLRFRLVVPPLEPGTVELISVLGIRL